MTNSQNSISTRNELEGRIIAKAWRDPKYKARLIKDPKGVLAEELKAVDPSIDLPKDLKVDVHQETKDQYHLVLPRNPDDIRVSEVLHDGDLEAVAPQTIAVVVAGIAVVVGNTAGAVNNVGAGNVVAAGNVATTGNAVANTNTV